MGSAADLAPPALVDHFAKLADQGDHDDAWERSGDPTTPPEVLASIAAAYPHALDLHRSTPDECEDIRQRVFENAGCLAEVWLAIAADDHVIGSRGVPWLSGFSTLGIGLSATN